MGVVGRGGDDGDEGEGREGRGGRVEGRGWDQMKHCRRKKVSDNIENQFL